MLAVGGTAEITNAIASLDGPSKRIYAKLLAKNAKEILAISPGELPYPACGSILDDEGIMTPSALVEAMPLQMVVDEYFGMCYQRDHRDSRYTPETKEIIKRRVAEAGIDKIVNSGDSVMTAGFSMASVPDLVAVFGEENLKHWWLNSTPSQRNKLGSHYETDFLFEELKAAYGMPKDKKGLDNEI